MKEDDLRHKYTAWIKDGQADIIRVIDIYKDNTKKMLKLRALLTNGLEDYDPILDGEYYFELYEKHKDAVSKQ